MIIIAAYILIGCFEFPFFLFNLFYFSFTFWILFPVFFFNVTILKCFNFTLILINLINCYFPARLKTANAPINKLFCYVGRSFSF
jgi:hypothetical protein